MITLDLIQPAEVPGEDVQNPPFLPVPSGAHVSHMTGGPWESATQTAHSEHREWCLTGCAWCDGHRMVGYCPECGQDRECDDLGWCVACREAVVQAWSDDR